MSTSANQTENNSCTLNNARVEAENVSCHNCRPQLLATCVGLPTYLPTWECWGGKAEPLSGTGRIDDLRLPPWYRPRPLPPLNVSNVQGKERKNNENTYLRNSGWLAAPWQWPGQARERRERERERPCRRPRPEAFWSRSRAEGWVPILYLHLIFYAVW